MIHDHIRKKLWNAQGETPGAADCHSLVRYKVGNGRALTPASGSLSRTELVLIKTSTDIVSGFG